MLPVAMAQFSTILHTSDFVISFAHNGHSDANWAYAYRGGPDNMRLTANTVFSLY